MIKRTESEILFEAFCNHNSIKFEQILTRSKEQEQTPDYEVRVGRQKVIVEIKQIDPNPEEIRNEKLLESQRFVVWDVGPPGTRVRSKITAAAGQIRIKAKGKYPSVLIVYNSVPLAIHTDPYSIRVAMYGLETHILGVPEDMNKSPYLIDKKFGPKRRMTKDEKTYISAIANLVKDVEGNPQLLIFHNVYAEIPLMPELFRGYGVRQFTLEEKVIGKFQDWKEI